MKPGKFKLVFDFPFTEKEDSLSRLVVFCTAEAGQGGNQDYSLIW